MPRRLETFILCVCIIVAGNYWFQQVRQNDIKLETVRLCADGAGTSNGIEWKSAWDACLRGYYNGTP